MSSQDIVPGLGDEGCYDLRIGLSRIDGKDSFLAIELIGNIEIYNSECLRGKVLKAIEAGFSNIIFLLQGVEYISSAGLGAFVYLLRAVEQKGGTMVLSSMQPSVKNVFKMMCFDRLFHCVDSPGEAPGFSETEQTEPPFPKVLHCPNCGKLLKAKKAGRYRCPGCARVLRVDPTASAALERSRS